MRVILWGLGLLMLLFIIGIVLKTVVRLVFLGLALLVIGILISAAMKVVRR
ncbi:MAG: hypothetical protein KatS3mg057_0178 [Herpetosiphonaceae bacterium]|nr:MAG: hypothetical protein KatS3mg057_0178 [Herpetosiphonaceae bacterium]